MKRSYFLKFFLMTALFCIFFPVVILFIWSVTGRWSWPNLFPETYTLRTIQELFLGAANLWELLFSSISLALVVAVLGTIVGILTARATELYEFKGKKIVKFGSFLPLMVPGTVFAMGIQITLIRMGLTDTIMGIILVHLIAAVPYCITIMTDITAAVGDKYEQQAMVLGAGPFTAFFQVTLPALMPGILSSMSMAFILSYSQYFTTLMVGGGRIKTISLILVPYIQSGDRALSAAYSVAFAGSALIVFFLLEGFMHKIQKRGTC